MAKSQRKISKHPSNRCDKEEFLCQGWESSNGCEYDEAFSFCSSGLKCKYLNKSDIVISPTLFLKTQDLKHKAVPDSTSSLSVVNCPLPKSTINQSENGTKIFTKCTASGHCALANTAANKRSVNATEDSGRLKRLICITENNSPSRYKVNRMFNACEEKVNTSVDHCDYKVNVSKTSSSLLCVIHQNKNTSRDNVGSEDSGISLDVIENYRDAIAKLRNQKTWKQYSNPPESVAKSSFHGQIQTCILQLSNGNPTHPNQLITCEDTSFIKGASGKDRRNVRQAQGSYSGHHQCSLPTSSPTVMSKTCKAEKHRFVWSKSSQERSKVNVCEEKTVSIPTSSGKENALQAQRNKSAPRCINSSQSQTRNGFDTSKDLVPSGSHVTLGLMLKVIRNGLKQNEIKVMVGQTRRSSET
ncbi:uncharacterized protein LOC142503787 isoform X2 [Ascaphus truei]|uniref:uncharacterized protein LOC142503787 isoform X2 n=1 Tax=Ascaphus truei TaxID=8439 RepID=UPI003F59B7F6